MWIPEIHLGFICPWSHKHTQAHSNQLMIGWLGLNMIWVVSFYIKVHRCDIMAPRMQLHVEGEPQDTMLDHAWLICDLNWHQAILRLYTFILYYYAIYSSLYRSILFWSKSLRHIAQLQLEAVGLALHKRHCAVNQKWSWNCTSKIDDRIQTSYWHCESIFSVL